jgi:diaminopimelate decarboxylase
MNGFERVDGTLACEGVALDEIAGRFGTPLYVYSWALIEGAFRAYAEALRSVPHRICYALKANSSGAILRLLAGLGAGADIVSGGELLAAERAGFPANRIVFAGVGKSDDEIALGLSRGIAVFNAESEAEIERIASLAGSMGQTARVALRVNPDIDARSHPYISTGLRESKFGVDIDLAVDVLERARRLPALRVVGVQCHIGSQIADLAPVEEAARAMASLSRDLLRRGFALETLDLGGGLGVDYDGAGVPGPEALAARVVPEVRDLPLTLVVEPGRSLVGAAGILLTRVLSRKENRGKSFEIVDAGMNDLLRPALYDAFHRIEPVASRRRASTRLDVVGPVCETGDFLARDREMEDVERGELLAVLDAGAYGFAMSSRYNMRARAAEVLVEEGRARLIRRRETFEDLIATEVDGQ